MLEGVFLTIRAAILPRFTKSLHVFVHFLLALALCFCLKAEGSIVSLRLRSSGRGDLSDVIPPATRFASLSAHSLPCMPACPPGNGPGLGDDRFLSFLRKVHNPAESCVESQQY